MRSIGVIIVLFLAGSDESKLPSQPSAARPQPTREFSLSGLVQDAWSRSVADCRGEIIDGPRSGTFVMTALSGGFEMPGVFSGPITVQTSRCYTRVKLRTGKSEVRVLWGRLN